jgi:light-regulated signal transduction histidine kinase (bacteriophytochrome)
LPHWVPKLRRSLKQAEKAAQHHRIEQALRERAEENSQSKAELEDLVWKQTKDLQAATKELEAFSYSVSHDLRAPLRHINAFIYLLEKSLRDDISDESRERLQVVASAAEHLGHLVDDLINLSRVGRQELRKIPVPLDSLVAEAKNHLRDEVAGRKVDWEIGNLPVVHGDPIALRQVFVNLLSNALKYSTPRARATIEIGCHAADGETVCFVRDNGVGFNMDHVSRLFGVFQRLHSEREFEGTGIGLAIVRRIIQRHGGRVWAEGAVDRGATFFFSLPSTLKSEAIQESSKLHDAVAAKP